MIGKKFSDMLLDGKVLSFYEWEGEVKDHMKATVAKVDALANTWSEDEKKSCLDETALSFRYSGVLMFAILPPLFMFIVLMCESFLFVCLFFIFYVVLILFHTNIRSYFL